MQLKKHVKVNIMRLQYIVLLLIAAGILSDPAAAQVNQNEQKAAENALHQAAQATPIPLIFDTDIGNDVDDALALGMIHAFENRHLCRLIAVTITKDHPQCAGYVDAVNTFYGRGNIPIGVCRSGTTPEPSSFTVLADQRDEGAFRYPHDLISGSDAPSAVKVLRQSLVAQPDRSVVIVQVGFSTNLADLLETPADDVSPLNGRQLVEQKVKLLSVMGGAFAPVDGKVHLEYNIVQDIPAAKKLCSDWPTQIIFSGFEIGLAAPYPATSILQDYSYVAHHPLAEAYVLYSPPPHNRPTWDLTSVRYAISPERGYFGLSPNGRVQVTDTGETTFEPADAGNHRYLTMSSEQQVRVVEALVQLSSQPPQNSQ